MMSEQDLSWPRFELLSKEAQQKLTKHEYTVICLMVLLAATSIVWSISIHILSGDFYHRILGAKLIFRERDFRQMNERSKEIFYQDLGNLINATYTDAALEAASQSDNDEPMSETSTEEFFTTKAPKAREIQHLFQRISNTKVPDELNDADDEADEANTTALPKLQFNVEHDRKLLATMTVDVQQTYRQESGWVQFIYSFPFLSEIIAIIWTAMCLVFQSGVNKYWGLPKPWRIVIPSILVFTLMFLGTLTYTILAQNYLKHLCNGLREDLTKPDAISCGQAISVLRPLIRQHEFRHDVYLTLFRVSYILSLVLWLVALLVMLLRYLFAIDFQLVDVQSLYERKVPELQCARQPEFTEVLLDAPARSAQQLLPIGERHRSEDDFQSAKSQLSEVATPLLDNTLPQSKVV